MPRVCGTSRGNSPPPSKFCAFRTATSTSDALICERIPYPHRKRNIFNGNYDGNPFLFIIAQRTCPCQEQMRTNFAFIQLCAELRKFKHINITVLYIFATQLKKYVIKFQKSRFFRKISLFQDLSKMLFIIGVQKNGLTFLETNVKISFSDSTKFAKRM